jgi:hypothetical protein
MIINNNILRFDTLCISNYEDSKCSEMSLLPNTETIHNSYAACGCRDNTNTAQKHKANNDISLLWPEKEIINICLEIRV